MTSGRLVRLHGLRLPEAEGARAEPLKILQAHRGRPVRVSGAADDPDRWGRTGVDLAPEGGPDLAALLVAQGLGLVDAGIWDRLCRPDLLALENEARRQRLGLWRDSAAHPIRVGDVERLRERVGRFTLVEGRVRSVGERRGFTYLNFGADWSRDMTAVLSNRTWREALKRGLSAAALRGRRVRVRGIVVDDRGPRIDLASADLLELLEDER